MIEPCAGRVPNATQKKKPHAAPDEHTMKDLISQTNEHSSITAAMRVVAFLSLTLLLIPVHVFYELFYRNDPFRIPQYFHQILTRILGFKVRVHGHMAEERPLLFVANHTSYLDIPVLGSLLPAAFIAKSEVEDWPFFGFMARLQHTVFIERRSTRASAQKNDLKQLLDKGYNLILFPEGTSSDGQTVLPFKSSLFSIVETAEGDSFHKNVTIQPISIACTELDGLPITRSLRPYYAWFGDMTLVNHLWNVFKFGRFTVDVIFHPPITTTDFKDRKVLATYCQQQVAHGIEQCVAGRGVRPEAQKALPASV